MAKMVRKQLYLEPRHDKLVKERARRYKVTEAEVIRRALDRGLEALSAPDPDAWREIVRYVQRYRTPLPRARRRGGRRWTRDELYDR